MEDYKNRVIEEQKDLSERVKKLAEFIHIGAYASVPAEERARLYRQYLIMQLYEQVLDERILAFTKH